MLGMRGRTQKIGGAGKAVQGQVALKVVNERKDKHGHSKYSGPTQAGTWSNRAGNCCPRRTRPHNTISWSSTEGEKVNTQAPHDECSSASQDSCRTEGTVGETEA